jgi:Rrf2 family protein
MFSKACEYAIRAVIFIVAHGSNGKKVGIKDLCHKIGAPEHFTAKIMQTITRHGIVQSTKGPNGGFYIEEGAASIRLIDIVNAIDGDKIFTGCGLGLKQCSEINPCPIHHQFKSIRTDLQKMLEETKVEELTADLKQGLVFLNSHIL